ncbi:MsnO8 family LLM class oxidoreductase [Streptomyces sp. NPDC050560]|uniref:MsnO8 family LLM class oxidoreductase n=1 Tax=Streptomyces sp. NPDC050560 TaxID=3365630 RepID=UPI0037BCFA95
MIPLSVLDLALAAPGQSHQEAVHDVARTARAADSAGYHRFWVAEHHNSARSAGSSPAVLMAHLASATRRIRIGSGGVMLTNHAPLAVAEQFAVLQCLHEGRIDLGVGRASGGTDTTTLLDRALRRRPEARGEFPALVAELIGFLRGAWPAGHDFAELGLSPRLTTYPDVFVLGTTENGARVAAAHGLSFAYGAHLGRSKCRRAALDRYRDTFTAAGHGSRPYVIASLNVLCAPDDGEALRLAEEAAGHAVRTLHADTSPGTPLAPARERHLVARTLEETGLVLGGPATVADRLAETAADLGADELMLVAYDLTAAGRARTLRLTAEAHRARAGAAPAPYAA